MCSKKTEGAQYKLYYWSFLHWKFFDLIYSILIVQHMIIIVSGIIWDNVNLMNKIAEMDIQIYRKWMDSWQGKICLSFKQHGFKTGFIYVVEKITL